MSADVLSNPETSKKLLSLIPLGRPAHVDEIAGRSSSYAPPSPASSPAKSSTSTAAQSSSAERSLNEATTRLKPTSLKPAEPVEKHAVLKGRDFSRAITARHCFAASAAEGILQRSADLFGAQARPLHRDQPPVHHPHAPPARPGPRHPQRRPHPPLRSDPGAARTKTPRPDA